MASDVFSLLPALPACCHKLIIREGGPNENNTRKMLITKTKMNQVMYLEMLPGKPRCKVTSMCPTSMPNSRAFVAATPRRFPEKKSLSILLRSCFIS